jgi:hypothetical protein
MGMGMGFAVAREMSQAFTTRTPGQSAAAPPPIPGPVVYYVAIDGQQQGPFDRSVVEQKIKTGEINRTTLVWHADLAGWTPAENVAELSGTFAVVPPPLPDA